MFASAFEDAIVEGGNLRDVLHGLRERHYPNNYPQRVTKPIGEGISSLFTSSGGGNFLSGIFGSLFGGARASGGSVAGGKAYLVGSRPTVSRL